MDQGGGEYTGYIPGVYEGDDSNSMPSPIATTGNGMTVRDDIDVTQEAIRQRLLARERKQLEAARQAEGDTKPISGSVVTLDPEVIPKFKPNAPYVPPVVAGGSAPADVAGSLDSPTTTGVPFIEEAMKAGKGAISTVTDLIPEPLFDAGFGAFDSIMANVKNDWDAGGGALNPISRNNYIQQLIDKGANSETIARLMDKFMPFAESAVESAGSIITDLGKNETIASAFDNVGPTAGKVIDSAGNLVRRAGEFATGLFTPDPMPETKPSDPVSEIAKNPNDNASSFTVGPNGVPTIGVSVPTNGPAQPPSTPIGAGDTIQEKAMSVLRPAGALANESLTGAGDMFGDRFWDIFYNSIPGLDQRGQSGSTVTRPPMEAPSGHTVDRNTLEVDAGAGQAIGGRDRRNVKPGWMRWFTPDMFESENVYDDMTPQQRLANFEARKLIDPSIVMGPNMRYRR